MCLNTCPRLYGVPLARLFTERPPSVIERVCAARMRVCSAARAQGLPVVQAPGEAEAMCAALNAEGYVQGVHTPDSDALLFGAERVYKELSLLCNTPAKVRPRAAFPAAPLFYTRTRDFGTCAARMWWLQRMQGAAAAFAMRGPDCGILLRVPALTTCLRVC